MGRLVYEWVWGGLTHWANGTTENVVHFLSVRVFRYLKVVHREVGEVVYEVAFEVTNIVQVTSGVLTLPTRLKIDKLVRAELGSLNVDFFWRLTAENGDLRGEPKNAVRLGDDGSVVLGLLTIVARAVNLASCDKRCGHFLTNKLL